MDNYILKIDKLEEDMARLTISSNIVYDQSYHLWLVERGRDLFDEINLDTDLNDDEKGTLGKLISTIFEEVSLDI